MAKTRVYFEEGTTSVFAVALDWPGWCRRAKTGELAIEALEEYRERYARVVPNGFSPGRFEVIGTLRGDGNTDFGAPSQSGPWDLEPLSTRECSRRVGVLERCWGYFDDVVASSLPELRRGPRGGGRDRDEVARHAREVERRACPKIGLRVAPRTKWHDQRTSIVTALRAGPTGSSWTTRHAIARMAWHVLDHAWEIEDKQH